MLKRYLFLAALLLPLLIAAPMAVAHEPAVQAILFYSPTCPHCHQVITELLIPMQEEYGEQLQILGIDTTHPAGGQLYQNAVIHYEIPDNRLGVPMLIVSDIVLVGGREIPDQFPGLVEQGLADGGINWPDIPDLALIVPDLPPPAVPDDHDHASVSDPAPVATVPANEQEETAAVSQEEAASQEAAAGQEEVATVQNLQEAGEDTVSTTTEEPPDDPVGFTLAWLVLIGMGVALIYTARQIIRTWPLLPANTTVQLGWLVPLLALLGLGVALYLAYVEISQVKAVCGPVGECNIVQGSPYARIMGIPIAVLGLINYVAIIALWAGGRYLPEQLSSWSSLGLLLLSLCGVLFSIYLTCLEIFVIGAICAWCLSSAVLTTLIMILVVNGLPEVDDQRPVGNVVHSP